MVAHKLGDYVPASIRDAERLGVKSGTFVPCSLIKYHDDTPTKRFYEPLPGEPLALVYTNNPGKLVYIRDMFPKLAEMLFHAKSAVVPRAVAAIISGFTGIYTSEFKAKYEKDCLEAATEFHKAARQALTPLLGKHVYDGQCLTEEVRQIVTPLYPKNYMVLHTQNRRALVWYIGNDDASYYAVVGLLSHRRLTHLIRTTRGVMPVMHIC